MQEAAVSQLSTWQNFYVIVGTSAAALTGLMFVVVTLIAGTRNPRSSEAVGAFGTPTVFHFGFALFIAALLSAPWHTLWQVSLLLGLSALAGVAYIIIVIRRALRQNDYQPVLEDWLFHIILPFVSYAAFVISAIVLPGNPLPALFIIAAASLLLLFIGIHNSWDSVTYTITERLQPESEGQD